MRVALLWLVGCGTSTPLDTGDDGGDADADADCDPAPWPCRLTAPQCGCHDAERCTLDTDQSRICVPSSSAAGPGEGEPCGELGGDDCLDGAICDDAGGLGPFCRTFCEDDGDCAGDGGRCGVPLDLGPDAMVCSIDCDPRSGSGCPDDVNCEVVVSSDGGATDCSTATGSGVQGDACDAELGPGCARGFRCVDEVCRHYCEDPGGRASGCSDYQSCEPLDPPATIGGTEMGHCL